MSNEHVHFWVSIFQRSGQRFECNSCHFCGEFNSFRLMPPDSKSEVVFFCPSCDHALIFDTELKVMRAYSGQMIRPEVSLGSRWKWLNPKSGYLAAIIAGVLVLVLAFLMFARLDYRVKRLEGHPDAPPPHPAQTVLQGGPLDLSFPGYQEICAGYAIMPKSVVREPYGVRIRGVVVNEKSVRVDARFRFIMSGCSQNFIVENLAPGARDTFEVFLPGATDTTGTATIEVVETSLNLE